MAALRVALNSEELPSDPGAFKQRPPPLPASPRDMELGRESYSLKTTLDASFQEDGPPQQQQEPRVWTPSKGSRASTAPRENGLVQEG